MRMCALFLIAIALTSCSTASPPAVKVAVDTLCTSTTRPPLTQAMKAEAIDKPAVWEPLMTWLLGFVRTRDKACLTSSGFGD